ncbi:MAG: shikimate kinase [Lentisphaerota bacterium]
MNRIIENPENIVLIGMPGVGKSTSGILLAKLTSRDFIDTDVYIQSHENRRLQEILDAQGKDAFCRMEEKHILSLRCRRQVVATGGSVVYSPKAMRHLKQSSVTVYLTLPLPLLKMRLTNLSTRGVAREAGQTLEHLFTERDPLYRRYADVIVDCEGRNHEEVAVGIIEAVHIP